MAYDGAPTAAMVGEKLLHLIDAADGRNFTKSQDTDFTQLADHYMRLKAGEVLNDHSDGESLTSLAGAIRHHDVAAIKTMLTTPNGRKTRDGNPGEPQRERLSTFSHSSADGAQAPTGRKSVNTESWGDLVWESGSPDGTKALVPTGSTAVPLTLQPAPISEQQRVTFLRQLIPTLETTTGVFSYLRQTTRTNLAAAVAEGARKPTSLYALERVDDRVDTIAHLSEPIPRQYLEDAPLLRQFVDSELRYGLDLALDAEILAAIIAEASAAAAGGGTLTTTRQAITELQQADYEPTGIVMSPADWETIELEAQTTFAANPTFNPANAMTRRLYGIPVVVSNGMTDGTALIGDFGAGATLYMRQQARVDWSEATFDPTFDSNVGATDFERNLVRFRAEMRAKLAVTRPTAFLILTSGS